MFLNFLHQAQHNVNMLTTHISGLADSDIECLSEMQTTVCELETTSQKLLQQVVTYIDHKTKGTIASAQVTTAEMRADVAIMRYLASEYLLLQQILIQAQKANLFTEVVAVIEQAVSPPQESSNISS